LLREPFSSRRSTLPVRRFVARCKLLQREVGLDRTFGLPQPIPRSIT